MLLWEKSLCSLKDHPCRFEGKQKLAVPMHELLSISDILIILNMRWVMYLKL